MFSKQLLAIAVLASLVPPAFAQPADVAPSAGFYGGVALRDEGREADGVNLGHLASTWGRFASPVSDDTARRALGMFEARFQEELAKNPPANKI